MPSRNQFDAGRDQITNENIVLVVAVIGDKGCVRSLECNGPAVSGKGDNGLCGDNRGAVRTGSNQLQASCLQVANIQVKVSIGYEVSVAGQESNETPGGVDDGGIRNGRVATIGERAHQRGCPAL